MNFKTEKSVVVGCDMFDKIERSCETWGGKRKESDCCRLVENMNVISLSVNKRKHKYLLI